MLAQVNTAKTGGYVVRIANSAVVIPCRTKAEAERTAQAINAAVAEWLEDLPYWTRSDQALVRSGILRDLGQNPPPAPLDQTELAPGGQ